jgi:hypothetical protein
MTENKSSESPKRDLTREQITAMIRARKASEQIIAEYPEIVDDYRSGLTQEEIAEKYEFMAKYCVTLGVARTAVYVALKKLLSEKELNELEKVHHLNTGLKTYEQRLGIYSQTLKEWEDNSRKGGKKSGQKSYEHGVGLFGLTPQQRIEASRKAVISQGKVPWSDEEKAYMRELYRSPEYRTPEGFIDDNKISHELERKFGTKRSPKALHIACQHLGVRAFSHDQMAQFYRNRSLKSALAKGQTLWSDEEKVYLYERCQDPIYRTPAESIDYNKISKEWEKKFKNKRTPVALKLCYSKMKKATE